MATEIISKRCFRCKQFKTFSEFHKNKAKKDGLHNACKFCRKVFDSNYPKTEKGKATRKRYAQSEKGKIAIRKAVAKYRKTDKGRATQSKIDKRFKAHHPNQEKATNAVNNAIKSGKLPLANTHLCHYCPKLAQQYHHWHGYEKEHWLDVVPACGECHSKLH